MFWPRLVWAQRIQQWCLGINMIKNDQPQNILERIYKVVCEQPEQLALCYQDQIYSYSKIWQNALLICQHLQNITYSKIGIYSNRDGLGFCAILGCVMAGKTFVLLNPSAPSQSLVAQCESIALQYILNSVTEPELQIDSDLLFFSIAQIINNAKLPSTEIDFSTQESPLTIFFTSGSVGKPKAVAISHANLNSYIDGFLERHAITMHDRVIQLTEINFDPILHDIFITWSVGACLYIFPGKIYVGLEHFITKHQITVWTSVPTIGKILINSCKRNNCLITNLRWAFFGGEGLFYDFCQDWHRYVPNSTIVNCYGPTETTVAVSSYLLDAADYSNWPTKGLCPIGKPFRNTQMRLTTNFLDDRECLIAGAQLCLGYLDNQTANDEKFIYLDQVKWYRTGDIMICDEKGDFVFLGRKDFQIKRRGYRVELLEVEEILMEAAGSSSVAVVSVDHQFNEIDTKLLVGFVSGSYLTPEEIFMRLKSTTQSYLIPDRIIFLPEIPRTINNKKDYRALKAMCDEVCV